MNKTVTMKIIFNKSINSTTYKQNNVKKKLWISKKKILNMNFR